MIDPLPSPGAWVRLGAVAPVPFVGTATILVALIVFTPVLLATGPSPLTVQAKLAIYRVVGSPTTWFEVHALGDVPYARIDVALGTGFHWTGGCPTSGVNWSRTNVTNAIGLDVQANATPVVVNATAVYHQGGSTTVFAVEIAVAVAHPGAVDESLDFATCPGTPGESVPASWPVSGLPVAILLVNYGSGGPP